jgi:hypothetical protein
MANLMSGSIDDNKIVARNLWIDLPEERDLAPVARPQYKIFRQTIMRYNNRRSA